MKNTHCYKLLEAFKRGEVMTAYDAPVPNFSQRLCDLEAMGYKFGRYKVDGKRYFKYWLLQEKVAA